MILFCWKCNGSSSLLYLNTMYKYFFLWLFLEICLLMLSMEKNFPTLETAQFMWRTFLPVPLFSASFTVHCFLYYTAEIQYGKKQFRLLPVDHRHACTVCFSRCRLFLPERLTYPIYSSQDQKKAIPYLVLSFPKTHAD